MRRIAAAFVTFIAFFGILAATGGTAFAETSDTSTTNVGDTGSNLVSNMTMSWSAGGGSFHKKDLAPYGAHYFTNPSPTRTRFTTYPRLYANLPKVGFLFLLVLPLFCFAKTLLMRYYCSKLFKMEGCMIDLQLLNEWEWNLSHHTPTTKGIDKILRFREKVKELAEVILDEAPNCRERDHALTHLEEALLYANQAIARNETEDAK